LEKHFLDRADRLTVRNPRRAIMAAIAGADAMIHEAGRSNPQALCHSELAEDMTAFTSSCLGLR
jgi:hypothetical protein